MLLRQLCQIYDVYILVKLNSDSERSQIEKLLKNADLPEQFDMQHVVYCSTEDEKIQIVRKLSPSVHVEGGWELDDGVDAVQKLHSHTRKLIWVNARRRRNFVNSICSDDSDHSYQDIRYRNVELTPSLWDTSIAHYSSKMTVHLNIQHSRNKSLFL